MNPEKVGRSALIDGVREDRSSDSMMCLIDLGYIGHLSRIASDYRCTGLGALNRTWFNFNPKTL